MDFQSFLNSLAASLSRDGFILQSDSPELQSQGIKLFAAYPKYPVVIHRGNDISLFVGVKYSDEAEAIGFDGFLKSFHELVGSSLKTYLGIASRHGSPNWNVNLPVLVSQTVQAGTVDFVREFKPDNRSKFQFVLDHPVLVNIGSFETVHRETPAGRFGFGPWAKFFNDFVSRYLILAKS